MKHELRTWPRPFSASWAGVKPFEIRRNDRDFQVYDEVVLQEWDPKMEGCSADHERYTGREIEGRIDYITDHEQKKGYVVFTLTQTNRSEG